MSKMSFKYFSLSPLKDVDTPVYFEALDEKLNDDITKNIAVTGSYGSGKSSVLESYFAKRKVDNYLKVSLANFCESNSKMDDEDEKIIEEQILQQLFYQLSHDNIPFSGFKNISHFNIRSQRKLIISAIIWLFSLVLIPNIISLIHQNLLAISSVGLKQFFSHISWFGSIVNIIALGVFITGLYFIIKEIIHSVQKGQLKKIVMKSAQVELSEDSALNKHIDELIYFFEATGKKIVAIEDLDRFNSVELFSKLREVNFLINNSPKVPQTVKFIYAIRDEVFTDNLSRTKFFDFILPIVPVINTTNSGDILRGYLKDDKSISDSFINDISLYIHDLRLLRNIVNEYRIYSGVINKIDRRRRFSLFSIILYKNLFPAEFGREHSDKGFLYKIFNVKKTEIIEKLVAEKNDELKKLEDHKEKITSATTTNEEKLREEYVIEILKTHSKIISISDYTIDEILTDGDKFYSLIENPEIIIFNNDQRRSRRKELDLEKIQKQVNSNYTYEERLELIKQDENNNLKELDTQIARLRRDVETLKRKKLSALIKHEQDNSWKNILFDNKEKCLSSEEELLMLLIRKGYINENYQLYMSYFYEGALNLVDFEFLLNVKNGEGDNFNTELTNKNELISRISEDEYEYETTFNKQLILYLLEKPKYKTDKRLQLLLIQFKYLEGAFEKYILPTIDTLKNHKKELQRFLDLLVEEYYPTIWQSIDNQNFDNKTKDEFLKMFLFLPMDKIKSLNASSGNDSLKNYLSKKADFIDVFNTPEEIGNVLKLITALDIKFEKLNFKEYSNNQVFNHIYQHNHYILNEEMLYLMLFRKYNMSESKYRDLFYRKNYTCIVDTPKDALNSYIISNFDTYIKDIYLNLDNQQAEDESAISSFAELLADENKNDILHSVLNKITTRITDIDNIGNNSKWSLLFTTDCVEPNWKNLIAYFKLKEAEINKTIIKWLNAKDIVERLTNINLTREDFAEEDSDVINTFLNQIITIDKLTTHSYSRLLLSLPYVFHDVSLDAISQEKISLLIEYRKIKYNPHNYNLLLELGLANELYYFTTNNISYFIENYNDYLFDLDLNRMLLYSNEVSLNNKKTLVQLIPNENIKHSELASAIGNVLINSKEELVEHDKLVTIILASDNIDIKLKLLDQHFNDFKFHDINKVFENIGGEFKRASKLRKRPKWKNNTVNHSLAQKLKNIGYFHSCDIDKKWNEIKIVVRYS